MKAEEVGLLTDLDMLTMAQSYFQHGDVRSGHIQPLHSQYPPNRSYFVAAGLEDVLAYLEGWRFPGSR